MDYYVYHHKDPRNNSVMYVGLGQYDRAWCIRQTQRSKKHHEWIKELFLLGYTPNDFVQIVHNQISKEEATKKEKEDIDSLKPAFNKLLNSKHWSKNRNFNYYFCEQLKALREMGYTFENIAFLSGAVKPRNNAMTMKRMVEYV